MKNSLFILFYLIVGTSLMAQNPAFEIDTSRGGWRHVISPDGLNLRAKPNLRAQVLQKIPFGEKVQVISPRHYGRDTVGQIEYFNTAGSPYQIPIDGYWLKVRHGQVEGFMFSAYLGILGELQEEDKLLNQNFALLYPGVGCFNNIFYQPNWYWYGVYMKGNQTWIKRVSISFYSITEELVDQAISTNDNLHLKFVLGSRTPLPESDALERKSSLSSEALFVSAGKANDSILSRYNLAIRADKTMDDPNYWESQRLIFQKNGLKQAVKPAFHDGLWYLVWCGDLDGDKKDDYIIQFGEKGMNTVLFLSKPAEKGQIVKPVAVFYSGYCC